jgi:hypothetical protein
VGGLWVLLVGIVTVRTGALPRALGILGIATGAAGIATAIPILEAAGAVFGLGLIAWFVWLGTVLVRTDRPPRNTGRGSTVTP